MALSSGSVSGAFGVTVGAGAFATGARATGAGVLARGGGAGVGAGTAIGAGADLSMAPVSIGFIGGGALSELPRLVVLQAASILAKARPAAALNRVLVR